EEGCPSNVFGPSHTPHRDGGHCPTFGFSDRLATSPRRSAVNVVPHGCVHDARSQGIDSDGIRGQRQLHRLGHAYYACLAGAVDKGVCLPAPARLGGDIDDPAATALTDHCCCRRLGTPQRALAVHVHDVVPTCHVDLEERPGLDDPSIVYQDVQLAPGTGKI